MLLFIILGSSVSAGGYLQSQQFQTIRILNHECPQNSELNDSGECHCLEGYYISPSQTCEIRCHYTCKTCDSKEHATCLTCDGFNHRELVSGFCPCQDRFMDVRIPVCKELENTFWVLTNILKETYNKFSQNNYYIGAILQIFQYLGIFSLLLNSNQMILICFFFKFPQPEVVYQIFRYPLKINIFLSIRFLSILSFNTYISPYQQVPEETQIYQFVKINTTDIAFDNQENERLRLLGVSQISILCIASQLGLFLLLCLIKIVNWLIRRRKKPSSEVQIIQDSINFRQDVNCLSLVCNRMLQMIVEGNFLYSSTCIINSLYHVMSLRQDNSPYRYSSFCISLLLILLYLGYTLYNLLQIRKYLRIKGKLINPQNIITVKPINFIQQYKESEVKDFEQESLNLSDYFNRSFRFYIYQNRQETISELYYTQICQVKKLAFSVIIIVCIEQVQIMFIATISLQVLFIVYTFCILPFKQKFIAYIHILIQVAFLGLLTAMFVNYKINNEGWGEVILIGLILTLDIITLPYKFALFLRDHRKNKEQVAKQEETELQFIRPPTQKFTYDNKDIEDIQLIQPVFVQQNNVESYRNDFQHEYVRYQELQRQENKFYEITTRLKNDLIQSIVENELLMKEMDERYSQYMKK